jgi:hypothetical protein
MAVSEDLFQAIDHSLGSLTCYRIQFCMCSRFLHSGMLLRPQISYHIHKHVFTLAAFLRTSDSQEDYSYFNIIDPSQKYWPRRKNNEAGCATQKW